MHQIIHIDYMCNECGNCTVFCPYDSSPYRDKFTLFASESDMDESENSGFVFVNESGDSIVRLNGEKMRYRINDENPELDSRLAELITTVFEDYKYLVL